ncbi:putative cytokinetic ring protein SteA [Paenibacillus filicis]|uniref:Cytokinetic ring protein SteA n=1 Tax=Paenibacillus filicis TaxID=669464 RepID=A0ABU9DF59_9BACL
MKSVLDDQPIWIRGRIQADRSTKRLIHRLKAGSIAVIAHDNLDDLAVEGLIAARAAAVVNAGVTMTGEFPTAAPLKLLDAGIPLVETVPEAFGLLDGGGMARVSGQGIDLGTSWVPCRRFTRGNWQAKNRLAIDGEATRLSRFIENTLDYASSEKEIWLKPVQVDRLVFHTNLAGRSVVIVARGPGYRDDLQALKPYIKRQRPVLIGVDGGADALLETGWMPDLIVGDMDSVSDRALACGARLIVHGYRNGQAPGLARLQALDVAAETEVLYAGGTSEDAALLLAYDGGCESIVGVGLHSHMQDYLEKGRPGMGSSWLVRMKVGSRLVDARGISRLLSGPHPAGPGKSGWPGRAIAVWKALRYFH